LYLGVIFDNEGFQGFSEFGIGKDDAGKLDTYIEELQRQLQLACEVVKQALIRSLMQPIPCGIDACLRARGWYTED
jgi:hypothetical protein